jgi:hypothetical protein
MNLSFTNGRKVLLHIIKHHISIEIDVDNLTLQISISHRKLSFTNGRKILLDNIKMYLFSL